MTEPDAPRRYLHTLCCSRLLFSDVCLFTCLVTLSHHPFFHASLYFHFCRAREAITAAVHGKGQSITSIPLIRKPLQAACETLSTGAPTTANMPQGFYVPHMAGNTLFSRYLILLYGQFPTDGGPPRAQLAALLSSGQAVVTTSLTEYLQEITRRERNGQRQGQGQSGDGHKNASPLPLKPSSSSSSSSSSPSASLLSSSSSSSSSSCRYLVMCTNIGSVQTFVRALAAVSAGTIHQHTINTINQETLLTHLLMYPVHASYPHTLKTHSNITYPPPHSHISVL